MNLEQQLNEVRETVAKLSNDCSRLARINHGCAQNAYRIVFAQWLKAVDERDALVRTINNRTIAAG